MTRAWTYGLPPPPLPDPTRTARAHRRLQLRRDAWAGREPAEALSTDDRAELIRELWRLGWTDTEIAAHTHLTTYTTGRIRDRLGLPPNSDTRGVA